MVGVLLIGDEVLAAYVRESNINVILQRLSELNQEVSELRIVPDEPERIGAAARDLLAISDYLITAGGIGPTHDDRTIPALAAAFDAGLERHDGMLAFLTGVYGTPLGPSVARMALLPPGCRLVEPDAGHWPMLVWRNIVMLPGLPRALVAKMRCLDAILPPKPRRPSAEIFAGADESRFADWLAQLQQQFPDVVIGSYPVVDAQRYRTRLIVKGVAERAVARAEEAIVTYLRDRDWLVEDRSARER